MSKYFQYIILISLFSFSSCINDDSSSCKRNINIDVSVKDINYFNEPNSITNYIFSDFIQHLNYELTNPKGTIDKKSQSTDKSISGLKRNYNLIIKNLNPVNYTISLWGNLNKDDEIGTLHPNNKEYTDIFVVNDNININMVNNTKTLYLQRTKGKLRIVSENLPNNITHITMKVNNIYKTVDSKLNYTDSTHLNKETMLIDGFETLVAPSIANEKSIVEFRLYNNQDLKYRFSDIPIAIKRNEISDIRIKRTSTNWEIAIKVDGNWESIGNLTIEK